MANMPVIKEDDAEFSIDIHEGIAFLPPVLPIPPISANYWVHVCGAKVCWVSDQGNWGFMSSGDPSGDVYINDKRAIVSDHDIGFFVPHIMIPFLNAKVMGCLNLLLPLNICLSQAQALLGCSSVLVNDKPIAAGPYPAVNCSDPVPTPFGAFVTLTDVKVGVSWGDLFDALKKYAFQVAIAFVMMGAGKAKDKIKANKLTKKMATLASKDAAEKASRVAAEKVAKEAGEKVAKEAAKETAEKAAKEAAEKGAKEAADAAVRHEVIEAAEKGVKETAEKAAREAGEKAANHGAREAAEEAAQKAATEAAEKAQKQATEQATKEVQEQMARELAEQTQKEMLENAQKHAAQAATSKAEAEAAEKVAKQSASEASEHATKEAAAKELKDSAEKAHKTAVDDLKRLQHERAACGIFDGAKKKELDLAIKNAEFAGNKAAREYAEAAEREIAERISKETSQKAGREAVEKAENAAARAAEEEIAEAAAREAAEKSAKEAAEHGTKEVASRQAREAAEHSAQEMREKALQAGRRKADAKAQREAADQAATEARRKAERAAKDETISREEKKRLSDESDRLQKEAQEAAEREKLAKEGYDKALEEERLANAAVNEAKAREKTALEELEKFKKKNKKALELIEIEEQLKNHNGQYKSWGQTWRHLRLKYIPKLYTGPGAKAAIGLSPLIIDELRNLLGLDKDKEGENGISGDALAEAMTEVIAELVLGPQMAGTDPEEPMDCMPLILAALIEVLGQEEGQALFDKLSNDEDILKSMRSFLSNDGPVTTLAKTMIKLELYGLQAFEKDELCDIGIPVSLHSYIQSNASSQTTEV